MRKTIMLPTPQLSFYKEVNVDLDMRGEHYLELAEAKGRIPEEVALSITRSLMEEDANKLTINDLRYVFTLIKINSLENDYKAKVTCNIFKNGNVCGHVNEIDIRLSDSDLHPTPADYKVPEIDFIIGDTEKTYKVLPPYCDIEIALYDWMTTQKNISADQISKDTAIATEFAMIRSVCHLVDKDGNRVVDNFSKFNDVLDCIKVNKFSRVTELLKKVTEVNSFGVQSKEYTIKCEECGGTLKFRLPFLYGLVD